MQALLHGALLVYWSTESLVSNAMTCTGSASLLNMTFLIPNGHGSPEKNTATADEGVHMFTEV